MTHPERSSAPARRKPRRHPAKPAFPTLVLIPRAAALSAGRLADLQTLTDVFAHEHGDTTQATEARRAVLGSRVGASRGELALLTRRAEDRAWDRAIRGALAELAGPGSECEARS